MCIEHRTDKLNQSGEGETPSSYFLYEEKNKDFKESTVL